MPKKLDKNAVVEKEVVPSELQKLAHVGTKEAIEKIEKYIKTEKDGEKRAYAEMALEECEMFYYQPKNKKEDEEFILCELINRKERYIDDQTMKIDDIKSRIEKLMLEKKVHEKVLAKHKNKKEEWKYNWMQDFVIMEENELHKIEEGLEYDEAWVEEAKKMITTERYKNMPARCLGHFDFDEEDCCEPQEDCCDREDCCENQ